MCTDVYVLSVCMFAEALKVAARFALELAIGKGMQSPGRKNVRGRGNRLLGGGGGRGH